MSRQGKKVVVQILAGYGLTAAVVHLRLLYSSDCTDVTAVLMLFLFLPFHSTRLATLILCHFKAALEFRPVKMYYSDCITRAMQGFYRRVSLHGGRWYLAVIITLGRHNGMLNNTNEIQSPTMFLLGKTRNIGNKSHIFQPYLPAIDSILDTAQA